MQAPVYLTTEEAADYLRLKLRKLYDLVAEEAVPCTKVTGKWLFPRDELDRWLASNLVVPAGMTARRPPEIVGGACDPLLERALRQSGSGLALLAETSEAGLERLARDEVMIAAIHLDGSRFDGSGNIDAVRARPGLADAVVIGFAGRAVGLMVPPGNPLGLACLAGVAAKAARLGHADGGGRRLVDRLAAREGVAVASLSGAADPFDPPDALITALRGGAVDCAIGSETAARLAGFGFVPLADETIDLVMRRRSYFEPAAQRLMDHLRGPRFTRQAGELSGYDISRAGFVRFNR